MEYSIQQLASLAGISTRTLRFYDQSGLLLPSRVASTGYRIYDASSVDRLQLILLYRELDFNLDAIRQILAQPGFNPLTALREQRQTIALRKAQFERMIETIDRTIEAQEGGVPMSDQAKFEGIKNKLIADNEARYGAEVRERYGEQAVDQSNAKLKGMSQVQFDQANQLASQIIETLLAAMDAGDPAGALAAETARLHREWLMLYWPSYSPQAHAGLARMYVEDERFKAYYEQHREGAAVFLREAILSWTQQT
jgi:DNA-binding transcriptional MerR regulator